MGEAKLKIMLVDDHYLVRMGLSSVIALERDMTICAEASTGAEAIALFRTHRPDVTLMDLRMPLLDGVAASRAILKEWPDARIIALTSYAGDQDIYRALEAGVRAYLLKEMAHSEIVRAIRTVHSGKRLMQGDIAERLRDHPPQTTLTAREVEVLRFVAQGLGNKEIGDQIGTAAGTVKIHIQNILSKLGAADRTHAVVIALRRGILHLDT